MNILHVITHGGWAGSESIAAGIANGQAKRGDDVTVILRRSDTYKTQDILNKFDPSINIFWVEQSETHPDNQIKTLLKNNSFIKKINEVDILHAHLPYGCLLGKLLKERLSINFKICASMHVRYHPLYYFSDKLFTVAKWQVQEVPKDYTGEIHVIENFLCDNNKNNEKRLKIFKKKYYISKNKKYIIYIGRLDLVKGADILIRAFKKARLENYKLIIIGDGPEANNLKKIASNDVIFTGKILDASFALEIADISIIPSRFESFGLVLLEAINSDKRIIATNIPSFKEILGSDDYLFENESVESLSQKIKEYVSNPSLGFAEQYIKNKFSLEQSLDKLEIAYSTLDIIIDDFKKNTEVNKTLDEMEVMYNV
ncbi:glycosyltransferase family 4 protein [Yersinia intermedia]|uniref:glycosyltransferase family 4 protein n=1 Tax=Yersinia intermedia TaxID=631 RepID=UPI000B411A70|nr:glycosyltransferase family 4 protein [Yersinia intermedia]OVZ73852.1 glycosyl transferase family 1 [Yersinia intermedia]